MDLDPLSFGLAGLQGGLNLGSTMLQNHYNKQLMQYQNDWNLEMWNRQNEYNSPKETMNRLVEAGINPRAYQQIGQFANAGQPQPAAQGNKISELSGFQSVVRQGLENELLSEKVKQERSKTDLNTTSRYKLKQDMLRGELEFIISSLLHGLDPEDINPNIVTGFKKYGDDSLKPAYKDSDLYKYISTGVTENPYLRASFLKNLLTESGVKLRDLEGLIKNKEWENFRDYGIRGDSNFTNLFRALMELLGDFEL